MSSPTVEKKSPSSEPNSPQHPIPTAVSTDQAPDRPSNWNDENAKLFSSSQEISNALDSTPLESLTNVCRRLKFHLRIMFQPTHVSYAEGLRVLVEYIDQHPKLSQIWTTFDRAQSYPPLQVLIVDILALLLSIPIPLPTYRESLFRKLLENHIETVRTYLSPGAFPLTTLATIRVMLHGTRAGMVQDIWNASLLIPYPHLASMTRKPKHGGNSEESTKSTKKTGSTIRSTYMQFMSAVIRSADSSIRQRLLEDRDYLGPLIRNMDHDSADIIEEWLLSLKDLLNDKSIASTTKSIFFNGFLVDHIRKLYTCTHIRTFAHAFLMNACTRSGLGMCHRDAGVYGSVSIVRGRAPQAGNGGPANRVLAALISKLDISDTLQTELLLAILAASPELASTWSSSLNVSMDPRPSPTWLRNADIIARFINLHVPPLCDPAHISNSLQVIPLVPPTVANILVHIAPSPLILRSHFMRGLAVSSPVVLFTTFRLILAVLDKLDQSLIEIRKAAHWWANRDSAASCAWNELAESVAISVAKQLPDTACVLKALMNAHAQLGHGSYELPASIDEATRSLEMSEDVSPTMVYLCAVRVLKFVSRIFPDRIPPSIETSDLLFPIPAHDLCIDLLELLIECPPTLSPRSLATLLRLHATGHFCAHSLPLLTKLLQRSPLFDGCAHEISWWLEDLPDAPDVIVWMTNLFGFAQKNLYAMADLIVLALHAVDTNHDVNLPFSPMAVALVQNLSANNPTSIDMPNSAQVFGRVILMRILASQPDPRPLQSILEKYQLFHLSQGVDSVHLDALNTHPVLCISRSLQRLRLGDNLQQILNELSSQFDLQPNHDDAIIAAQFRMISTHPSIVSAIFSHPDLVSNFCVRNLASTKSTLDSPLRAIALEFAGLFLSVLTGSHLVTNAHARCVGAVYLALGIPLNLDTLPTTRLSARQWLSIVPALCKIPVSVAKMVMTSTNQISELHINLMLQVLQAQFSVSNVRNYGIRVYKSSILSKSNSALEFDLGSLPVDIIDNLVDTSVTNPEPKQMVLTILTTHSLQYLQQLLALCLGMGNNVDADCVIASINACVQLGPGPDFCVSFVQPDVEESVKLVARRTPQLIHSTNLKVAMTLYESLFTNCMMSDVELVPTLASYATHYKNARFALSSNPQAMSDYIHQAIEVMVAIVTKQTDLDVMDLVQFMTEIASDVKDVVVSGETADKLIRMLLNLDSNKMPQTWHILPTFMRAWTPIYAPQLTSNQLSQHIDLIMSILDRIWDHQHPQLCANYVHAMHSMMRTNPKRLCKQDYMYKMIGMYNGTTDLRDQAILYMLYTFESLADTNLGPVLMTMWGGRSHNVNDNTLAAGIVHGNEQELVKRSMAQIDVDLMYRTALQFPIDVDLNVSEPGLDCNAGSVWGVRQDQQMHVLDCMFTRAVGQDGYRAPAMHPGVIYDVQFMVPMIFKYLENGNSIDIGMLVDKGLVALAIAALASNQPKMRRAALVIMDEFYGLIPTSRIKGKATLVHLLDMIRHFIGVRSNLNDETTSIEPEYPQLPVITASFMTYAIMMIQQPSHPAYVPLLYAIMDKPTIDPESVPGLLQVINKPPSNTNEQQQVKDTQWAFALIESILRSGKDAVLLQHRHILDWIQEQLMNGLAPNQRASLNIMIVMSIHAAQLEDEGGGLLMDRAYVTSGMFVMLQLFAETCNNPAVLVKIMEGIVCTYPIRSWLVLQALVQLAMTCLNQVLVQSDPVLDTRKWMCLILNMVTRFGVYQNEQQVRNNASGMKPGLYTRLIDRMSLFVRRIEKSDDCFQSFQSFQSEYLDRVARLEGTPI